MDAGKMNDKKVLIIDDDVDLLHLVGLLFRKVGSHIFTARDGLEGISKLFIHRPDLIILDVMIPGTNGFEICERIRQVSATPIILLTALNHEDEMLHGLEIGADDFLSKPFNPEILLARARAVLRRGEHLKSGGDDFHYNNGYLSIDVESRSVLIKGKTIKLTPVEFRLLVFLARNAGKVLTHDHILANVWGNEYQGSIDYVHVYISHLRTKIEENTKHSRFIRTVHGIGYLFEG
jgi:DNA-binding response OmpR family regulator